MKNDILIETLNDEIAVQLRRVKITPESFVRWGDKNNITRSIRSTYLSKSGQQIDKIANAIVNSEQFDGEDEQAVINEIIDFILTYPNAKSLDKYFSERKKEQTTKTRKVKKEFDSLDVECFLSNAKESFKTSDLRYELEDLAKNPNYYFGQLYNVDSCKNSLLTLPPEKQKYYANLMLAELNKPIQRKRKRTPPKPKQNNYFPKVILGIGAVVVLRQILKK